MYELSNTNLVSDKSRLDKFIAVYKKVLLNIIYFGLFLFIGGIYIFPNDSGTQQVFYLLITLPFLLLFPFIIKELPWNNKYLYIYMAFPLYMFASHFWAKDDSIERDWFFFFRQLLCFLIFLFSCYIIIKEKQNFLMNATKLLLVSGFLSALISLIQHGYIYDEYFRWPIKGFSIVDVDKVGAIHTIHLGLCVAFGITKIINRSLQRSMAILLVLAMFVDLFVVYLTQAVGLWLIILCLPFLFFLYFCRSQYKFLATLSILLSLAVIVYSNDLLENLFGFRSAQIRIATFKIVIEEWLSNVMFGSGLTYKDPISTLEPVSSLSHSHNIFLDTLRFGGCAGVILLVFKIVFSFWKVPKLGYKVLLYPYIWAGVGLLAACLYSQQPYVRPGSYVWFFYWMPMTILIIHIILSKNYHYEKPSTKTS